MSQIENQTSLFEQQEASVPNITDQEPEMVRVDAKALREVLQALISPGPAIRELMMLRGSSVEKITGVLSPISLLMKQYDEHCENSTRDQPEEAP